MITKNPKNSSKITKTLKYGTFIWDDEARMFEIFATNRDTGEQRHLYLNKVYAFAFLRFVVRMAQRNWYRKRKK